MPVKPNFERICRRGTAAFIARAVIRPAGRMRFHRIRLAPGNVCTAAVCFPTWNSRCVVLVCICDSLVILLAIFVFFRVRIRIAAAPEIFDKVLALFIGRQRIERPLLFLRDDIGHVRIAPFLVGFLDLANHLAGLCRRVLARLIFTLLLCKRRRAADGKNQRPDRHIFDQIHFGHNSKTPASLNSGKLSGQCNCKL